MFSRKNIFYAKRAQIVALINEGFPNVILQDNLIYLEKVFKIQLQGSLKQSNSQIGAVRIKKRSTTPREEQFLIRVSLKDRRKKSSELAVEFREATNKGFKFYCKKKVFQIKS